MIVPQLVPDDQAAGQKSQRVQRHRSRSRCAFEAVVVQYDIRPGAPTLQQAQEMAAGYLADLLMAWFETHGQGVAHE